MAEFENAHLRGKSLTQLIDDLGGPVAEPGSPVWEMYRAAIDAKIAEQQAQIAERQVEAALLQADAARSGVRWARWSGLATIAATLIALTALLIAVF